MQIRVFTIPCTDTGALQAEMNAFLSGHKILEVEKKFFQNENGGTWTFCVQYITGTNYAAAPGGQYSQSGKKVDYKEVLSESDFAIFSKLRVIRKELAATDGVPPYAVFTDAELAEIVKIVGADPRVCPEINCGRPVYDEIILQIRKINGIGEKKIEKYAKTMIGKYCENIVAS